MLKSEAAKPLIHQGQQKAVPNSLQPTCGQTSTSTYIHAQSLLTGTFPDAWLLEHGLICTQSSHLDACSHITSHLAKYNQSTIPPTVTPLLDTDSILPSIEDIRKLQCNTIRHIPAKSRPAFELILLANLRSASSVNDEMSWLKFSTPQVHPCFVQVLRT